MVKDSRQRQITLILKKILVFINMCIYNMSYLAAAYTYYKTLSQETSLQRRGKLCERKKLRRHHERITRVSSNLKFSPLNISPRK